MQKTSIQNKAFLCKEGWLRALPFLTSLEALPQNWRDFAGSFCILAAWPTAKETVVQRS